MRGRRRWRATSNATTAAPDAAQGYEKADSRSFWPVRLAETVLGAKSVRSRRSETARQAGGEHVLLRQGRDGTIHDIDHALARSSGAAHDDAICVQPAPILGIAAADVRFSATGRRRADELQDGALSRRGDMVAIRRDGCTAGEHVARGEDCYLARPIDHADTTLRRATCDPACAWQRRKRHTGGISKRGHEMSCRRIQQLKA